MSKKKTKDKSKEVKFKVPPKEELYLRIMVLEHYVTTLRLDMAKLRNKKGIAILKPMKRKAKKKTKRVTGDNWGAA